MDIKRIAWIGSIYQKFEAMCLEVDEIMCQETAKYVENQVQTVGASMKRLCSDVKQAGVASHDLSLNPYLKFGIHKTSISSIKEDAIDPVCINGISLKKSNSRNDFFEDWSVASFNWEISDNDESNCDRINVQALNEATVCESRGQQEGQMCNLIVDTSFASSPPGTTVFTKSSTGTSAECDPDLEEKKENYISVKLMEPIEHESESVFEETCVLVDENDYRLDNHKQEIRPSYKKKIQSAFSLKKKSSRKQEYKQLAAQYGKFYTELDILGDEAIPLALTISKNIKSNKLATNDSIESEWELL